MVRFGLKMGSVTEQEIDAQVAAVIGKSPSVEEKSRRWLGFAKLYYSIKSLEKSLKYSLELLGLKKDLKGNVNLLVGTLHFEMGNWDESLKYLKRSVEINPGLQREVAPSMVRILAKKYEKTKERSVLSEAKTWLKRFSQSNPHSKDVFELKELVFTVAGEFEDLEGIMRKQLENNPSNHMLRERLLKLICRRRNWITCHEFIRNEQNMIALSEECVNICVYLIRLSLKRMGVEFSDKLNSEPNSYRDILSQDMWGSLVPRGTCLWETRLLLDLFCEYLYFLKKSLDFWLKKRSTVNKPLQLMAECLDIVSSLDKNILNPVFADLWMWVANEYRSTVLMYLGFCLMDESCRKSAGDDMLQLSAVLLGESIIHRLVERNSKLIQCTGVDSSYYLKKREFFQLLVNDRFCVAGHILLYLRKKMGEEWCDIAASKFDFAIEHAREIYLDGANPFSNTQVSGEIKLEIIQELSWEYMVDIDAGFVERHGSDLNSIIWLCKVYVCEKREPPVEAWVKILFGSQLECHSKNLVAPRREDLSLDDMEVFIWLVSKSQVFGMRDYLEPIADFVPVCMLGKCSTDYQILFWRSILKFSLRKKSKLGNIGFSPQIGSPKGLKQQQINGDCLQGFQILQCLKEIRGADLSYCSPSAFCFVAEKFNCAELISMRTHGHVEKDYEDMLARHKRFLHYMIQAAEQADGSLKSQLSNLEEGKHFRLFPAIGVLADKQNVKKMSVDAESVRESCYFTAGKAAALLQDLKTSLECFKKVESFASNWNQGQIYSSLAKEILHSRVDEIHASSLIDKGIESYRKASEEADSRDKEDIECAIKDLENLKDTIDNADVTSRSILARKDFVSRSNNTSFNASSVMNVTLSSPILGRKALSPAPGVPKSPALKSARKRQYKQLKMLRAMREGKDVSQISSGSESEDDAGDENENCLSPGYMQTAKVGGRSKQQLTSQKLDTFSTSSGNHLHLASDTSSKPSTFQSSPSLQTSTPVKSTILTKSTEGSDGTALGLQAVKGNGNISLADKKEGEHGADVEGGSLTSDGFSFNFASSNPSVVAGTDSKFKASTEKQTFPGFGQTQAAAPKSAFAFQQSPTQVETPSPSSITCKSGGFGAFGQVGLSKLSPAQDSGDKTEADKASSTPFKFDKSPSSFVFPKAVTERSKNTFGSFGEPSNTFTLGPNISPEGGNAISSAEQSDSNKEGVKSFGFGTSASPGSIAFNGASLSANGGFQFGIGGAPKSTEVSAVKTQPCFTDGFLFSKPKEESSHTTFSFHHANAEGILEDVTDDDEYEDEYDDEYDEGEDESLESDEEDECEENDEDQEADDADGVAEEECDVHFKPVVELPEVEVKTFEEDEDILLELRAKLYRLDKEDHQWKERGVGEVKLLKHKETGKTRLLMRRDKTHKICANHYISPYLNLQPMSSSDRAWIWNVFGDFADEEPKDETFAIKFGSEENAHNFKLAFEKCVRELGDSDGEEDAIKDPKSPVHIPQEASVATSFTFTPTPSSENEGQFSFTFPSAGANFEIGAGGSGGASECGETHTENSSLFPPAAQVQNSGLEKFPETVNKAFDFSMPISTLNAVSKEEEDSASEDDPEDEEPDVEFEPVVNLPEVEVQTLEEDEDILLKLRAKLYRFDKETKQWKERGVGEVKLLQHKDNGKIRLLMRRDKTLKICANHLITDDMELCVNSGSEKSWLWNVTADFVDDEVSAETLAIRFGTVEDSQKFKSEFSRCVEVVRNREGGSGVDSKYEIEGRAETSGGLLFEKNGAKDSRRESSASTFSFGKASVIEVAAEGFSFGASEGKERSESTSSGFSFGVHEPKISNEPAGSGFSFGQQDTSKLKFLNVSSQDNCEFGADGTISNKNAESDPNHDSGDDDEDDDHDPQFQPIIDLPEVEVQTMEEDEDVLFEMRAKLFRFDKDSTQWKERGVGNVKFLKHKETGKIRLLMRREKTLKICANHYFNSEMKLSPMSEKSWIWLVSADFSEGEVSAEQLAIRLGSVENAEKFKSQFESCVRMASYNEDYQNRGEVEEEKTTDEEETEADSEGDEKPASFEFKSTLNEKLLANGDSSKGFSLPPGKFQFNMSTEVKTSSSGHGFVRAPTLTSKVVKDAESPLKDSNVEESISNQEPKGFSFGGSASEPDKFGATSPVKEGVKPSVTEPKGFFFGGSTSEPAKFGATSPVKEGVKPSVTEPKGFFFGGSTSEPAKFGASSPLKEGVKPFATEPKGFSFSGSTSEPAKFGTTSPVKEGVKPAATEPKGFSFGGAASESANVEKSSPVKEGANIMALESGGISFSSSQSSSTDKNGCLTTKGGTGSSGFVFGGSSSMNSFASFASVKPAGFDAPSSSDMSPFGGKTSQVFGSAQCKGEDSNSESEDSDNEEHEPDIDFQPIVDLPEVEVKTMEEDEDIVFKMRAKLFRFDKDTSQWKERGVGEVKLLEHKTTKKIRLLMRREKTLKICANHYLTSDMVLSPNVGSEKSWVWHVVADFSDDEPKAEQLAIRFGNVENAVTFRNAFEKCVAKVSQKENAQKDLDTKDEDVSAPFQERTVEKPANDERKDGTLLSKESDSKGFSSLMFSHGQGVGQTFASLAVESKSQGFGGSKNFSFMDSASPKLVFGASAQKEDDGSGMKRLITKNALQNLNL